MNNTKKVEWYDNANIITNSIIVLILLMMILSQSFAINNNLSTVNIFRNIINHNINYFLVLVYFISLKTKSGKKYFNYLNIFLVSLYFVFMVTSILSVFQAVSLQSLLSVAIKVIMFFYLLLSMFRDNSYFKELNISKFPLDEFNNDWYFNAQVILSILLLAVNLVLVSSFDGAFLAILDCFYVLLLARYIYLYREYLDYKEFSKSVKKLKKNEEVEN